MLEDIEMLEDILNDEEYCSLDSSKYKEEVIEYITSFEIEELSDEDQIAFMKKLTKVASMILKDDPESLDDILERIYDYHVLGIKEITDRNIKKVEGHDTRVIVSHLHSHAAKFASRLFEKTKEEKWAAAVYSNNVQSAERIPSYFKGHVKHVAINYQQSADFARKMFYFIKAEKKRIDVGWAENVYKARKESVIAWDKADGETAKTELNLLIRECSNFFFNEDLDNIWGERLSTHVLELLDYYPDEDAHQQIKNIDKASIANSRLYQKTKNVMWKKREYNVLMKKVSLLQEINDEESQLKLCNLHSELGMVARDIFNETKEESWGTKWYLAEELSARGYESLDMNRAAVQHGHSGKASKVMYDFTKNPTWLIRAYESKKTAGEINEKLGKPKNAVWDFMNVAINAKLMYSETGDLEWAERWYEYQYKHAYLRKETGSINTADIFENAAIAAKELYSKTQNIGWLEKEYDARILCSGLANDRIDGTQESLKNAAHKHSFSAVAAKNMYLQTKATEWAERWYAAQKICLETVEKVENFENFQKNALSFFAHATKELFRATEELKFCEEWYMLENKVGNAFKSNDEKRSNYAINYAGDAAAIMFEHTGLLEWAESAINQYKTCMPYFSEKSANMGEKIGSKIKYLEEQAMVKKRQMGTEQNPNLYKVTTV